MRAIYFDMDGTIADLYAVEGWLSMLRAENPAPYEQAAPIGDLSRIITLCEQLKAKGFVIGVISWTAKEGTKEYNKRVRAAKLAWLQKYFNIADEIHVIKYGTPKHRAAKVSDALLFDDEQQNCIAWERCKGCTACRVSGLTDIENMCSQLLAA